ncbi:MAG: tellurite resistance TerB family protein [Hyphococcus sp.]
MIEKFLKKLAGGDSAETHDDETDRIQLALAALLVEAARADEEYADHEIAIIDRVLAQRFGLTPDQTHALRAKAEAAQAEALDIQRFTKIAKGMPREEKVLFVEALWEIVLSDGVRDKYEDALIRRICGLIYLDDPESGAARARVAARL